MGKDYCSTKVSQEDNSIENEIREKFVAVRGSLSILVTVVSRTLVSTERPIRGLHILFTYARHLVWV